MIEVDEVEELSDQPEGIERHRNHWDLEYHQCDSNSDSDDSLEEEFFDQIGDKKYNLFAITRAQRQGLLNVNSESIIQPSNKQKKNKRKTNKNKEPHDSERNNLETSNKNTSQPNDSNPPTPINSPEPSNYENNEQIESSDELSIPDDRRIEKTVATTHILPTDKISEQPNIAINPGKYDHIFFLFDKSNCELQKKLQHKLQLRFHFNGNEEFYSYDEHRTILFMPLSANKQINESKMLISINKICNICEINDFHIIAINVDLKEYQLYLMFKTILLERLDSTMIHATIFLNKVIEISDVETIDEILKSHHGNILAGHPGFERMKNTIQKKYRFKCYCYVRINSHFGQQRFATAAKIACEFR